MFFSRILVILTSVQDVESAAFTVRRALERAARPEAIRFVVSQNTDAFPPNAAICVGRMEDVPALTQAETHFLLLGGKTDFLRGWDQRLQGTLQRLPAPKALLSGCMEPPFPGNQRPKQEARRFPKAEEELLAETRVYAPCQVDDQIGEIAGQAYLPALQETTESHVFRVLPGLPLVCAAQPVPTLVLNPSFLFGPTAFLQECGTDIPSFSLTAYLKGYQIYVPTSACLWPLGHLPEGFLRLPAQMLPGTTVSRFARLLRANGSVSAKSTLGLFGTEYDYPQMLPPRLRLRQRLRGRGEKHLPLFVSAFIDLPQTHRPATMYLLRFGFLRKLGCMPLLLYTGGSQERALRAAWPNTQSYPERAIRELLPMVRNQWDAFDRSKVMLMLRAFQRQPAFSHVAWVDMDILPHPICQDAIPLCKPLMDEHIHLATVDGVPDLSFVVIPASMLKRLEKEIRSITQLDVECKRDLSEEALWARLYQKSPEDFVLHPMPARELLFASIFDQELLSDDLRRLLAGQKPIKQEEKPCRKN